MRRTVLIHANRYSGCDADADDRAGDVGIPARARRRRAASEVLGLRSRRQPGSWGVTEKLDWRRFSDCYRIALSFPDQAVVCRSNLEEATAAQRVFHSSSRGSTLAHSGCAPQSALFLFWVPRRPRGIPRLSLVLFHQRTGSSLPQSALSARLQYRPSSLVLALPLSVALSMERVLPHRRQTFL